MCMINQIWKEARISEKYMLGAWEQGKRWGEVDDGGWRRRDDDGAAAAEDADVTPSRSELTTN